METTALRTGTTARVDWPSIPSVAAVAGVGVLGYLMMGLYDRKKGKMTKLEKAYVALVIALGEKVEDLVKRNAQLDEILADTDRKLVDAQKRVDRLAAELREASERANRAEASLAELQASASSKRRSRP